MKEPAPLQIALTPPAQAAEPSVPEASAGKPVQDSNWYPRNGRPQSYSRVKNRFTPWTTPSNSRFQSKVGPPGTEEQVSQNNPKALKNSTSSDAKQLQLHRESGAARLQPSLTDNRTRSEVPSIDGHRIPLDDPSPAPSFDHETIKVEPKLGVGESQDSRQPNALGVPPNSASKTETSRQSIDSYSNQFDEGRSSASLPSNSESSDERPSISESTTRRSNTFESSASRLAIDAEQRESSIRNEHKSSLRSQETLGNSVSNSYERNSNSTLDRRSSQTRRHPAMPHGLQDGDRIASRVRPSDIVDAEAMAEKLEPVEQEEDRSLEVIDKDVEERLRAALRAAPGSDTSRDSDESDVAGRNGGLEAGPEAPRKIVLNPQVQAMQSSVASVLSYYYNRPENMAQRSPWGTFHMMLPFGVDANVVSGRTKYNTAAWLCGNRPCKGQRLLTTTRKGRIYVKQGVGLQGHQAQLLAMLAPVQDWC